jgi:hypothetical protein
VYIRIFRRTITEGIQVKGEIQHWSSFWDLKASIQIIETLGVGKIIDYISVKGEINLDTEMPVKHDRNMQYLKL